MTRLRRIAAVRVVVCCASAFTTPVGVRRIGEQAVCRELTASVLSNGRPSAHSSQVRQQLTLGERYRKDARGALAELHTGLGGPDERQCLLALSELSFTYYAEQQRGVSP
jgi:hypothetical protein